MLRDGYGVASINYRLSQHALFPAQIDDYRAAVKWLRANAANYKLDPARFAAWGPSAGGHLAALLGAKGDVQAVIDFFGATDLTRMDEQCLSVHNDPNSP